MKWAKGEKSTQTRLAQLYKQIDNIAPCPPIISHKAVNNITVQLPVYH